MARKKSDESVRAIAARLSIEMGRAVTQKAVRVWQEKGYPVNDTLALERKLRNQERSPKKTVDDSEPDDDTSDQEKAEKAHLDIEAELRTLQRKLIEAKDYDDARTIKTQIAGVRDVLKSLREQEYYVTKESQLRRGIFIGQTIKSLVLKIPAELPQATVGLEYAENQARCEDYAYSILTQLTEAEEGFDA
tara:strand:+ start:65 stop:637 length:573 start_codon:yes stop_codon:yes gene_type:complete